MQVWPNAHPCHFWLSKIVRHWNCANKYILIELNELVVFVYGLRDTQDKLWCLRNEIYILLWLTSSPCDKNSGERFRAHVSSCFVFLVSYNCYVALPHGAKGLSAVCDWGISWSYSLTIFARRCGILNHRFDVNSQAPKMIHNTPYISETLQMSIIKMCIVLLLMVRCN